VTREEKLVFLTEVLGCEKEAMKVRLAACEILNRMQGHNEPDRVSVDVGTTLYGWLMANGKGEA
jgi:hypothetical protein